MVTPTFARDHPLRVSVLSAERVVRAGVTQLLSTDPQRVCVVEEGTEPHVNACDVTVCDLADLADLIGTGGNELVRLLVREVPIVGLVRPGPPDLTHAAAAIGVATTVSMSVTADELVDAVEAAVSNHRTDSIANPIAPREAIRTSAHLSGREMEILELIVGGLTNNEIAETLWLSINSVKTYIRSAYRKIGVTKRPEAVLWGYHHGLTRTAEDG